MLLRDESCVELTEWFGVMRGWEDFLGDNEKIVELYAHPHSEESVKVKELTDEEIEECYWGDGYPDNPRHPKEFARAILRKAQEK